MLGLDEKVIAVMYFGFLTNLFTGFTVHVCNMFTHLNSDNKWLVEMAIPFLQYILSHLLSKFTAISLHSEQQKHHTIGHILIAVD